MIGEAVLRYRSGNTERVRLDEADTGREVLHVTRENGEATDVPFGDLKAVFFPTRSETHAYPESMSVIAVEFADGEVIRGNALYNPEKNGFFLYPHDRSKNDRVFVVNSAIVSIEVERL
jgi:hypothetical protein